MQKFSERNHDEVSALMESEIDQVKKVHRFIVQDSEWEELERVEREEYEEGGLDERHVYQNMDLFYHKPIYQSKIHHDFPKNLDRHDK